ncbi:serine/threonine-protein kinase [Kitasatospora azatica]|uniref:serine/threonine-protein kinase n=1 Tax=Kitasatospora azatica TaxID=58347 RepID=UPI00068A8342|nr:serine/threonine-protein kinase [Kitasatospora azatica]
MEPLESDDPRQVGGYRLLRRLGAGGMGRVYLGRTAGGRTVAVKLVRGELAEDGEFRARFRREVEAARRVGGRWTAPVLDADTESRHPWVATGYVAGPTLGAAVREHGPLPPDSVAALGTGLAQALVAVHGLGLVHRDVKPSNVMLTLDGPLLIDFGIARALDAGSTKLTQSGYAIGSPGFMSPEQARGEPTGPAGDVFSVGAVLAYAGTGIAPFGEGISAAGMLYRLLYEEPELGALDPQLRVVVQRCLVKDPEQRLTPAQLRDWLDAGGAATAVLGRASGWLPPAVSAAVGRRAVELLALDGGPAPAEPTALATVVERAERPAEPVQPMAEPEQAVKPTVQPPDPGTVRLTPAPPSAPPAFTVQHSQPRHSQPQHSQPRHSQPQPSQPRRRRGPLVALAVLVLAGVTAGAVLWANQRQNANGTPSASQSTLVATVPEAFRGQWQGTLGSGTDARAFSVVVYQGQTGQQVATVTRAYLGSLTHCSQAGELVAATTSRLDLKVISAEGACESSTGTLVLALDGDRLHFDGDGLAGDLSR